MLLFGLLAVQTIVLPVKWDSSTVHLITVAIPWLFVYSSGKLWGFF